MVEQADGLDRIGRDDGRVVDGDQAVAVLLFPALRQVGRAAEHDRLIAIEIAHDKLVVNVLAGAGIHFLFERRRGFVLQIRKRHSLRGHIAAGGKGVDTTLFVDHAQRKQLSLVRHHLLERVQHRAAAIGGHHCKQHGRQRALHAVRGLREQRIGLMRREAEARTRLAALRHGLPAGSQRIGAEGGGHLAAARSVFTVLVDPSPQTLEHLRVELRGVLLEHQHAVGLHVQPAQREVGRTGQHAHRLAGRVPQQDRLVVLEPRQVRPADLRAGLLEVLGGLRLKRVVGAVAHRVGAGANIVVLNHADLATVLREPSNGTDDVRFVQVVREHVDAVSVGRVALVQQIDDEMATRRPQVGILVLIRLRVVQQRRFGLRAFVGRQRRVAAVVVDERLRRHIPAHHADGDPIAHRLLQRDRDDARRARLQLHGVRRHEVARVHGVSQLRGSMRRKVDPVKRLERRVDGIGVLAGLQRRVCMDGRVESQPVGHPIWRPALRRALNGKTGQIGAIGIGHIKGEQHRAVALIHLHLE